MTLSLPSEAVPLAKCPVLQNSMHYTFETATNFLRKLSEESRGQVALTVPDRTVYNETFFRDLLASLMMTVPEVQEHLEALHHFNKHN